MGFIVFIHVVVCVLLIITILMQAGRGGGLAESFASAESMFGTQTNSFMVKVSTILAIIFFSTSLILAINASKGQQSLMAKAKVSAAAKAAETKAAEANKTAEPSVKVSEPKPMVDAASTQAAQVEAVVTNTAK